PLRRLILRLPLAVFFVTSYLTTATAEHDCLSASSPTTNGRSFFREERQRQAETVATKAGKLDDHRARTIFLQLHAERHVGFGTGRWGLRLSVLLPHAERLVPYRRCAVAFDRARCSGRLHAGLAFCHWRLLL